jgi:hypothetical protein
MLSSLLPRNRRWEERSESVPIEVIQVTQSTDQAKTVEKSFHNYKDLTAIPNRALPTEVITYR